MNKILQYLINFLYRLKRESPPPLPETIVEKGDYVIVFHSWFVGSKGFKEVVVKDKSYEDVKMIACQELYNLNSTFNHTAFTIIQFKGD